MSGRLFAIIYRRFVPCSLNSVASSRSGYLILGRQSCMTVIMACIFLSMVLLIYLTILMQIKLDDILPPNIPSFAAGSTFNGYAFICLLSC